jgi:hypothetical protein
MPSYILELSLGGTMRLKIEAPMEEMAIEMGERYFIEDWENAGPLKLFDIHVDGVAEVDGDHVKSEGLDASIVYEDAHTWTFAKDDPYERGHEEDEDGDGTTDPAG